MKKLLLCSTIILLVLSCHIKKDPKEVTELLTEYFTKASNEAISIEERTAINQKALKLVLESENKNDSLILKNVFKIAKVYESIGNYYKKQTPDSAYLYYTQAQKYYTLIKDKENTGKMLLLKASVQYYDGDLSRSEMFCLEALHYFNDVKGKNQGNLYDTYNFLGVLANDRKEYHKALEYHNKALQIILKDSSINNRATLKSATLNNLGVVYRNKDENQKALSYFYKALDIKDLHAIRPVLYAMLLDNTAYSHFKLKQYTGVQDLFYKALRIRETLNIVPGIVMSKLHMSEYYHQQKDLEKALCLAQEAHNLAKTKGTDPRNVMLSLQQLQVVDPPLKDVYAIGYNHIADSLKQVQPKIHETITQELAQAEAKEEAEIKKKEKIKTVLIELGVIACFVGVHYIMHRREKRSEKRVAQMRAELEANAQEKQVFIQEKENHIKVYDLMLKQKSDDHYFIAMIRKLINDLRKYTTVTDYIDKDIVWNDIESTIQIHIYRTIEDCFKIVKQNKDVTMINFEIFKKNEKDVIIIIIECNTNLQNSITKEMVSNIKKTVRKLTINNQKRESIIEVTLKTKLSKRLKLKKNI